jgi:lipopolysaccharide biosynthesis protein
MTVRALAIHLPQFHPIKENDEWWGKGFTEWTNVSRARPLFPGHRQPQVPADLGYTDLRLAETRQAQAEMARRYGVHGFCYYHYWFEGHRLIERPVNEILASGEPDFPFSLCWANETWSRRWLGEEREILLKQTYSPADHERHARWLAAAFADKRYVRVHDRPIFLIYRPLDIPDLKASLDIYRRVVEQEMGRDPFLVAVDSHRPGHDFRAEGFDYSMNFRPQLGLIPGVTEDGFRWRRWWQNRQLGVRSGRLKAISYDEFLSRMQAIEPKHDKYFPSVFVDWDNTPRRGERGVVVVGGSPERFRAQVGHAVQVARTRPEPERVVFINAWNEWAEGNKLEPDQQYGHAYLEALRAGLADEPSSSKGD